MDWKLRQPPLAARCGRLERRLRQTAARLLTPEQRLKVKQFESALRAPRPGNLDALARHYGTDKGPQDVGIAIGHNYTSIYHRHFGPHRKTVRSLLEIGVGGTSSVEGYETPAGGQSLRMWSRYFPNASIVGD